MKEKPAVPKEEAQPERVATIKQGQYSDGHPLDTIQYLEAKIILKGDRFTSVQSFHDFAKFVRQRADQTEVGYSTKRFDGIRPQIREVLFLDTADFRLYNNAFILRRRLLYEDGFPVGDPEVVFKFRHPDIQKAAEMDVRPKIPGKYEIKFKSEALPLKEAIGGIRLLYSHNVQFPLSLDYKEPLQWQPCSICFRLYTRSGRHLARWWNWSITLRLRKCCWISPCWISARGSRQNPMWRCGGRAAI